MQQRSAQYFVNPSSAACIYSWHTAPEQIILLMDPNLHIGAAATQLCKITTQHASLKLEKRKNSLLM